MGVALVYLNTCMNVTATVEVNVRQVFSLLVFILAVNSIRDAMTLKFGDLNARARDPTATSGLITPVDEANGRVSPKASIRGTVQRLAMRTAYG